MTESEWLCASDFSELLDFLLLRASNRKLRLLACACCHRIWDLLKDKRSRQAILVAEKHADGQRPGQNASQLALPRAMPSALFPPVRVVTITMHCG
jgi:hypothetical protein